MADSRVDLLQALGLDAKIRALPLGARANVKSVGALEIEGVRVAQELRLHRSAGFQAVDNLLQEMPVLANEHWTERFDGDIIPFGQAYMNEFRRLSEWAEPAVEALFHVAPVSGRNMATLTDTLAGRLGAYRPNRFKEAFHRVLGRRP